MASHQQEVHSGQGSYNRQSLSGAYLYFVPQTTSSLSSYYSLSTRCNQTKLLSTRTIHSWIQKLIKRSTDEKRVSLCSIASSLALQSGIPKEDIVTMGNWSSSSTFENHYRREHSSSFDFTNTLITSGALLDDDSNDDVFYDAADHT